MNATTEESTSTTVPAEPKRKRATRPVATPKILPPYMVVLHNDPINGFDYVINVLTKVFRYGGGKAFWLTMKAHFTGRSIVWSGSLEVAELKVEQIRSAGPDPRKIRDGAQPLKATAEPMP